MAEKQIDFGKWDKIYSQRSKYENEYLKLKFFKRIKVYKDEEGTVRCTKCGATQRISQCIECETEKEYLKG